jgi:hypothetical protein
MAFPASLTSLPRPTASQPLNNPSHVEVHDQLADEPNTVTSFITDAAGGVERASPPAGRIRVYPRLDSRPRHGTAGAKKGHRELTPPDRRPTHPARAAVDRFVAGRVCPRRAGRPRTTCRFTTTSNASTDGNSSWRWALRNA